MLGARRASGRRTRASRNVREPDEVLACAERPLLHERLYVRTEARVARVARALKDRLLVATDALEAETAIESDRRGVRALDVETDWVDLGAEGFADGGGRDPSEPTTAAQR